MDLIYEHPKRIGAEFCQKTIDAFENLAEMGCVRTRHDKVRRDNQTNLASIDDANMRNTELSKEFFGFIDEGLNSYIQKYNLHTMFSEGLWCRDFLVQRSIADMCEQYSTWHCEASSRETSDRAMTFIVYLNDNYKGGETQMLFQKKNIKPEMGKLVIFPAYYTHIHRGNMIEKGTKYIATGWIYCQENRMSYLGCNSDGVAISGEWTTEAEVPEGQTAREVSGLAKIGSTHNGTDWVDERTYKQKRKLAYPDIGDQLDDLFVQGHFSSTMAAKIQKVKDDIPKT